MCVSRKCPNWSQEEGGGNYRQLQPCHPPLSPLLPPHHRGAFFCISILQAHWAAPVFKIPLIFAEDDTAAVSGCQTLALWKPHRFHVVPSSTVSSLPISTMFHVHPEMEGYLHCLSGLVSPDLWPHHFSLLLGGLYLVQSKSTLHRSVEHLRLLSMPGSVLGAGTMKMIEHNEVRTTWGGKRNWPDFRAWRSIELNPTLSVWPWANHLAAFLHLLKLC